MSNIHVILMVAACLAFVACSGDSGKSGFPFNDPTLPVSERVDDHVLRMTLEEKVSQLVNNAPAIERLGVPAYDWWNECLHGVARAGRATVFPQAIGLAAVWDEDMMFRVATAISDEARAKHHDFVRSGKRGMYQGLTFWTPNINIFRDPRWGCGMETYGEDPGEFEITVGGKQPGFSGTADAKTTGVVSGRIRVTGAAFPVE